MSQTKLAPRPAEAGHRLITEERIGGLYILGVEAGEYKTRSELRWRMAPA
jgi:hypothetical protein